MAKFFDLIRGETNFARKNPKRGRVCHFGRSSSTGKNVSENFEFVKTCFLAEIKVCQTLRLEAQKIYPKISKNIL